MLRRAPLLFVTIVLSVSQVTVAQHTTPNHAATWLSHIQYLASDELAGRETGSEGHRRAAQYIAAAFKRAGLKPGGTQGYFQPVKFISRKIVEEQSTLAIIRNPKGLVPETQRGSVGESIGKEEPIVLGEEATFSMGIEHAPRTEAPIVFVGYGLTVPEMNYDDLAGLDLRGKVVLLLSGGPSEIPGPLRAHYQNSRWEALKRAGVIGVIGIQNPIGQDIPWERSKLARLRPALSLADPGLEENAGQQLAVTFNPAKAERLFVDSGHSFAEIMKLAEAGKPLPRFAIPAIVRASVRFDKQIVESQNIAGILPGADPRLRNEYVVLTAHLDHVGKGEPINGDPIYNGAMDNASGIATLLEAARTFSEKKLRFRRSVVFLAVTAEEHGLRGSKYYAAHPTVQARGIVANINIDMFLPLFPFRSFIVQGLEESNLADDLQNVARSIGVEVLSDPEPERRAFVRSDQYSFIRQGVPAISLKVGFVKDSPEHEIVKRWRRERYHAPSDDLQQPIDFEAA
ncbi:MAG TPA: M20/M25/M40 family metallo-hydrolase, partial [Blastocatellia bacterium]|nr:M20/M25/M40 family metallo-hydrolase [Blastocatellia bacterium]